MAVSEGTKRTDLNLKGDAENTALDGPGWEPLPSAASDLEDELEEEAEVVALGGEEKKEFA